MSIKNGKSRHYSAQKSDLNNLKLRILLVFVHKTE